MARAREDRLLFDQSGQRTLEQPQGLCRGQRREHAYSLRHAEVAQALATDLLHRWLCQRPRLHPPALAVDFGIGHGTKP
jgi:hypothetical protein